MKYNRADDLLVIEGPYFETAEPVVSDDPFTYTDGPPLTENTPSYEWRHALGKIVTAIAEAGLHIEFLHEHRDAPWQAFPWLEPVPGARLWRLADRPERLPMMYSLLATKPVA